MPALEAVDLAKKVVEVVSDKQASNIVLLDMQKVCSFTDYLIICSGESQRQIEAISQAIDDLVHQESLSFHHREGMPDSGWILFDLGEVMVHIFSPFERDYYQLENLWNKANLLVRMI
jgi:ribosome-associated protein